MKASDRFNKLVDKYADDPAYVAEGLLIDINEQIVSLLSRKEVTRTQLAQMLDVSTAYISKLLNGNENLTIKQLVRLAVALDCCIDVALVPKQYAVNRFFSCTPKRVEAEGVLEPITLVEGDEPNFCVAA